MLRVDSLYLTSNEENLRLQPRQKGRAAIGFFLKSFMKP
jgi:hypothetical protein